jgi:glycosyltransferase involved in cell wall biosynthesis
MGYFDVSSMVRRDFRMNNVNTVVFVANRGYALTSSRKEIIQRFLSSGWDVVIATEDDNESRELCALGATLEPISFKRGGFSLVAEIRAFRRLIEIYKKCEPDLIHHFHAKPVIFGSIAANWVLGKKNRVVNTITGLGHAFMKGGLIARFAGLGYKIALSNAAVTVFQNRDDQSLFINNNWVLNDNAKLIISSGVDLKRYSVVDRQKYSNDSLVVVMLGRLLRQKGIMEFVDVAKRVRKTLPNVRFLLAGEEELVHPDAININWIESQVDIEYLGRLPEIIDILAQADIFLFPSYYREGVPRVILEAAAMGVPTVGFDVPGVREAVDNGKTGYLVKDRDVEALTEKVEMLISNKKLRLTMGIASRQFMEGNFDKRDIEEQYMQVYRDFGLEMH